MVYKRFEALDNNERNPRMSKSAEALLKSMQLMDMCVNDLGYLLKYKRSTNGAELDLKLAMDLHTKKKKSKYRYPDVCRCLCPYTFTTISSHMWTHV